MMNHEIIQPRPNEAAEQDPATLVALEIQELCLTAPHEEEAINTAFGDLKSMTASALSGALAKRRIKYEDAQEVIEHTYFKVYKALEEGRFEGRSKIGTYIHRALLNNLDHHLNKRRNQIRREKLVSHAPDVIADERYQPEVLTERPPVPDDEIDPRAAAILNTIERVSPRDKQIFYWAKVDGYSHEEIAKKLAAGALGGVAVYMTVQAIKVAVSRTKQKARQQLS